MDLAVNTLFTGKVFYHYPSLDSTNNEMKRLLSSDKSLVEGAVIIADTQLSGRGQIDNFWWDESGKSLLTSVYYTPKLDVSRQFCLNQLASLAVAEFIRSLGIENVVVKWPNDVLVSKKKIAGILIDNSLVGSKIQSSIIGIGINLNYLSFPGNLVNATSCQMENQQTLERVACYASLFSFLEKWYLKLSSPKELQEQYLNTLFGYNEDMEVVVKNTRVRGKIVDVLESGEVALQYGDELAILGKKEFRQILN